MPPQTQLKALILAAGRGARMRPLSDQTPKPLLTVGGKPIIEYSIDVAKRTGIFDQVWVSTDDNEIERIFNVNAERCREKYPNYSEANARKTIARARTRGFVISDVIELPGVRSIAVPLRDKNNVPIAGISVSTLTTRMDKARSDLALSEITKAIEQIQQHLLTAEPD